MVYFFHINAGEKHLEIKGELFKYLIKVRRHTEGDILNARSKEHLSELHSYEIKQVNARSLSLSLLRSTEVQVEAKKGLHLAWCSIESKSVERVLASLCEMGVHKISFIHCDRSQKKLSHELKRYERIVEASMQQSGRSDLMEFNTYTSLSAFIKEFPETKVFDFSHKILESTEEFSTVLIGCEGGFSKSERELLAQQEVFTLNTPMILRSESAALAVVSKILL